MSDRTPEEEQLITDIYYLDIAAAQINPAALAVLEKNGYPVRDKLKDLKARLEKQLTQLRAQQMYPNHHPETALANFLAGKEIWDSNGDHW